MNFFTEFWFQEQIFTAQDFNFIVDDESLELTGHRLPGNGGIFSDILVGKLQGDDGPALIRHAIGCSEMTDNCSDPLFSIGQIHHLEPQPGISQPGAEHHDNVLNERGVIQQGLVEIGSRQESDFCFFHGNHRCRSGFSVQEGHLAEIVSLLVECKNMLLASLALVDNLYFAGKYYVHILTGIFFLEDDFVLVVPFFSENLL